MKILFLENNEIFSSVVLDVFLDGRDVCVCKEVNQAILALGAEEFSVALVDYDLDNEKGTKFVEFVRQNKINLKIIAISSHEAGNKALLKAGADAICPKMRFSEINDTINALSRHRS
jgi:DNA-binding response OmpR family regulator